MLLPSIPCAEDIGFFNADRRDQVQLTNRTPERLRFVMTTDFAPFGFVSNGRISGFHVDLARAICDVANLGDACSIQALRFDEIAGALTVGAADVALAGHAVTAENRERFEFSDPYFRWPLRFLVKAGSTYAEPLANALIDRRIGVLRGSLGEAAARSYFADSQIVVFDSEALLFSAVDRERVSAAFGDGIRFGFQAQPGNDAACCRLAGGAYLADGLQPSALSAMTRQGRPEISALLERALKDVQRSGKFHELLLRWFPFDVYGLEPAEATDQG